MAAGSCPRARASKVLPLRLWATTYRTSVTALAPAAASAAPLRDAGRSPHHSSSGCPSNSKPHGQRHDPQLVPDHDRGNQHLYQEGDGCCDGRSEIAETRYKQEIEAHAHRRAHREVVSQESLVSAHDENPAHRSGHDVDKLAYRQDGECGAALREPGAE